jgi:competence ComEA-like helix-hairpin-helix protein
MGAIVASVFSGGALPSANARVIAEQSLAQRSGPSSPPALELQATAERASQPRGAGVGPAQPADGGEGLISSAAPARRICINTASAAELELLPQIGPALATRIIEHRAAHGPFRTPADLDKVRGIGEKTLEKLVPLVSFEVVTPASSGT